MFLTNEGEKKSREVMLDNVKLSKSYSPLSEGLIGTILHSSFWNHLLRFIIINGKKYPTNSKLHLRGTLFLNYTNPHEEDIRVSYDEKKQVFFVEKMKLVPHPFLSMQRIDRDASIRIMMEGYEAAGYTSPDEKVQEWYKVGEDIPISKVTSLKIKSFRDRPKAIWNDRDDYTAYEIRIKTRVKTNKK